MELVLSTHSLYKRFGVSALLQDPLTSPTCIAYIPAIFAATRQNLGLIMIINTAIILLLARVPAISAHMSMKFPPPLNYELNPHRNTSKPIDKSYNDPLKTDGSDFPCRGYAGLMDTREGAEVATYNAGETGYFILEAQSPAASKEGGPHGGGSCQISLSYDRGETFKVIKSFIGSCPKRSMDYEQKFNFTIPEEAPGGVVILSWSWFNRDHEMFQNCASVNIKNGGGGISHLPDMMVANIGNGCDSPTWSTVGGVDRYIDTMFPDPGRVVEYGDGRYPLVLPKGDNC